MYPFPRLALQMLRHRNDPPLPLLGTHVSHHLCWPLDIDPWAELNNGRTLTLYDLGRMPLAQRIGLIRAGKENNWAMAVAGVSVRYRKRIKAFDWITMKSRIAGWDDRFVYFEQSMWKTDGSCANHALVRMAVTDKSGIINPAGAIKALGHNPVSPDLPDWIADWIAAESKRPWPPMLEDQAK